MVQLVVGEEVPEEEEVRVLEVLVVAEVGEKKFPVKHNLRQRLRDSRSRRLPTTELRTPGASAW